MRIRKSKILIYTVIIFAIGNYFINGVRANDNSKESKGSKSEKRVYTNKADNEKCLKCHGHRKYGITSTDDATKMIFRKMPLDYMIDTTEFYNANHWNFKCTDCHPDGYLKTPHNQELRFTQIPICIDCHGGDKAYAKYHFEIIESEFKKSMHYKREGSNFNCWSCHNPHYYKINARNKLLKISKTIQYDNNICLGCHDNNDNLEYFNKKISNIAKTHSWLPHQEDHFKKVRCIECHAVINDSILAPHNIQPKEKAIRECSKCHSTNSILIRSLYKSNNNQKILGFINPVILTDAYVAGSNRNYILNVASILIYMLTLFVISIHIIARINKKVN